MDRLGWHFQKIADNIITFQVIFQARLPKAQKVSPLRVFSHLSLYWYYESGLKIHWCHLCHYCQNREILNNLCSRVGQMVRLPAWNTVDKISLFISWMGITPNLLCSRESNSASSITKMSRSTIVYRWRAWNLWRLAALDLVYCSPRFDRGCCQRGTYKLWTTRKKTSKKEFSLWIDRVEYKFAPELTVFYPN
jgi:hypothetical protein